MPERKAVTVLLHQVRQPHTLFDAEVDDGVGDFALQVFDFRFAGRALDLSGYGDHSYHMDAGRIEETMATCHCGAVAVRLAARPTEVTDCNCSLCRSYGVLWAYCSAGDIASLPDSSLTETYAWNGRHVDFHRCRNCGCVTHWMPRDTTRDRRGINARLLPIEVLAKARIRHRDGAGTGEYLD